MRINMQLLKNQWQQHKDKIMGVMLIGLMLFISSNVFADGNDILGGLDEDFKATLKGSGKTYLYITEGVMALAMYIKTKNLLILSGIIVVACFFNIVLKVSGVSS